MWKIAKAFEKWCLRSFSQSRVRNFKTCFPEHAIIAIKSIEHTWSPPWGIRELIPFKKTLNFEFQLRISSNHFNELAMSRISTEYHESSLHANRIFDSYSPFACMLYLCDIIFIFNWTWFVFVHVKTTSRHTMLYLKWWFSHFWEITCINEKSRKAWEFRFYELNTIEIFTARKGGDVWERKR